MEAAITPKVQAPGVCLWLPMVASPAAEAPRASKDLIQRLAKPPERTASPAAEPRARSELGLLSLPPPTRFGPRRDVPKSAPAGALRLLPTPCLAEPPGRQKGPDALAAGCAGRAGPEAGQDAARTPVPPARPLSSLCRGRRQRRARRRRRHHRLRPPLPLRPRRRSGPLQISHFQNRFIDPLPALSSQKLPGLQSMVQPSPRNTGSVLYT